jgi:hypothetical protein
MAQREARGPLANSNERLATKRVCSQEQGNAENSVGPPIRKWQSSSPSPPARQGRVGRGSDVSIRGQSSSGYPGQSSSYVEDEGGIEQAGTSSRLRYSRLGAENQDKEETTLSPRAGWAWTSSNGYGRTAESGTTLSLGNACKKASASWVAWRDVEGRQWMDVLADSDNSVASSATNEVDDQGQGRKRAEDARGGKQPGGADAGSRPVAPTRGASPSDVREPVGATDDDVRSELKMRNDKLALEEELPAAVAGAGEQCSQEVPLAASAFDR